MSLARIAVLAFAMLKKASICRTIASASRRLAKDWRRLATFALVFLTLLNAGQGLLCLTLDGEHVHQQSSEQTAPADQMVFELNLAGASDSNEAAPTDCLHCAGMHAPLFTLTAKAIELHMLAASPVFPQIFEQAPPTRLSAHYRPPIYS